MSHKRRASYAVLFAVGTTVLIGFGALAIDVAWMRTAQSRIEDVADSASQAALLTMRRTGSIESAEAAALLAVQLNPIVGQPATMTSFVPGIWDEGGGVDGVFTATGINPNGFKVHLERGGSGAIPFLLAPIFGYDVFTVSADSTSAGRNLEVILVVDITNSWSPSNFSYARQAALTFLDTMADAAGPRDRVAMTVFTGRYAWEYTPFTDARDLEAMEAVYADWTALRTASKAGTLSNNTCSVHSGGMLNDFTSPEGGCYPVMPREYSDEPGTDHTTGIQLAATMFAEDPDPSMFRVMVVLTDGVPNALTSTHGAIRTSAGYSEARWRQYTGPVPRTTTAIKSGSIDLTEALFEDLDVHTYVVSFVKDDPFMDQMTMGQGYYQLTQSSAALVGIFDDIANAMPLAVVE